MTTITRSDADAQATADYVRFAQAEAARIPDFPQDLPLRPVNHVAVVGAGTMGGGIAMALANIGIPVTLIDSSQQGLDTGLRRVRDNYAGSVSRGKLEPAGMEARTCCGGGLGGGKPQDPIGHVAGSGRTAIYGEARR